MSSTRRPRGDGTVYFDAARGRYIGAVTIAGRRHKVSGKDKTEARAKLAQLLAAKTTETPIANKTITVAAAVATFIERDVPNRTANGTPLAPSTLETYTWAARIITDEIGKIRLAVLSVDDVEKMLDRLARRDHLSASSLTKIRGTLRRSLALAVRRGDAIRNPADVAMTTPGAPASKPRRSLSPDQARRLLDVLPAERLGAMYALMLRVALRPGEAAGLHWKDLEGTTLNITRAVRLTHGRAEVVDELKTASARRTIELPAEMAAWLAEHRAAQVAERLAAPTWTDDRLMFGSTTGNVLSPPNVRRDLSRICRSAGVPEIRPNELRHSCASLLSELGVPNELLADLLGHTTTRMVDTVYRHRLRPVVDVAARSDWTTQG